MARLAYCFMMLSVKVMASIVKGTLNNVEFSENDFVYEIIFKDLACLK